MAQYIDKDVLVKAIDRQKIGYNLDGKHSVEYDIVRKILNIIDTLEVKEVDFEKELDKEWNKREPTDEGMGLEIASIEHEQFDNIAKHFFELGINTQQNIDIDITNIDKVIEENGVDPNSKEAKMFKESYYTALEKLKVQKGE